MPDAAHSQLNDDGQLKPEAALRPEINRGYLIIQELEALSRPATASKAKKHHSGSSRLSDYSMGFASIDIAQLVRRLRRQFIGEHFIAADIGGCRGTAALDLERVGCERCFVIDPYDAREGSATKLPSNRFIQRVAENMEGVPNDCFHFIVSYNSLACSADLSRAISEISRVLKPGGIALIDIEWWVQGKNLATLNSLNLPQNVSMHLLYHNRTERRIESVPLAKALEIANGGSTDNRLTMGTGFIIQKAADE